MDQVLYKLPKGWEWQTLDQVLEKTGNLNPLKDPDKLWNYIDISSIDRKKFIISNPKGILGKDAPSRAKKQVQEGDVLFATTRPGLKNIALVKKEYHSPVASTGFCVLRANSKILPAYLFNFITTDFVQNQIKPFVGGASYPAITDNNLKKTLIPIPNIDEQKRIVQKLDALVNRIDTAIDYLLENLSDLKLMLASALYEAFHQEDNLTSIKDIFNVHNGRAYKKPELLDSGKYKVIRIQNLKGGENYYYSDLELSDNKYCEKGDLLFSWSGTPGTSFGAFIWSNEKAIYHYHIWKMEPKIEIAPRYAYWVLKELTEEAIANARGVAGMLHITKGTMESFVVSLPNIQEQKRLAQELDDLSNKSKSLQTEITEKIDALQSLKASILDSAFKGEL